jgi:hypothetical protein
MPIVAFPPGGGGLCRRPRGPMFAAPARMDPRPISDLRADLVPHREWAVSRWFYSNPIWYYHRRSFDHEIRPGGRFYRLVDPELREVCRLLNDAGAQTTPSCQGHSYPREHFEKVWDELRREETLIWGEGLVVKDCENDESYLFRQGDYRVPWPSFADFYREAAAHQNVGYLGILIPADHGNLARQLREDGYATPATRLRPEEQTGALLGGTLFEVRVETADPAARTAEWRAFTKYVAEVLSPAQAGVG